MQNFLPKFLIRNTWLVIFLLSCASRESIDFSKLNPPAAPEGKFSNPVLTSGPDPWVIQKDDFYYVCHTTGYDLRIYKTKTISKIAEAEKKTVWTPPATGMNSKNIWAPELHFINTKWYLYYAADDGNNNNHRMWILENASANPMEGEWVDKGKVMLPDDNWAIDGSAFEHKGQFYFMWSGWEGDVDNRQDIFIAKMLNPWTAEGNRIRLSKPELSWELNGPSPTINEGPQWLIKNDKAFIIYSASACWTDEYALGMLSANASADIMNQSSWTKSSTPVFSKNPEGHVYGPGHNSFFTSPDGTEDWIIYHANPMAGQGCGDKRSIRMQKFIWTADGLPDFGKPIALNEYLVKPSGE